MSLVVKKTIELCEAIAADVKFVKCQKVIDAFVNNEGDNKEYQNLLEEQGVLDDKKIEGNLSDDEILTFEAKCTKVFALPAVSEFLGAQDSLDQLTELINRHVDLTLEFGRVPTSAELEEECDVENELDDAHGHGDCGDSSCC